MWKSRQSRAVVVSLFAIGYAVAGLLFAQSDRGVITGTVSDATGGVVGGATVTVTNQATGVSSKASTNTSGTYTIPFLPPGVYTITAEQPGFKKHVIEKVNVVLGESTRQDISLQVGEITQSVEVLAEAPLLKADTSELGTTITNQMVLDLPLAGNDGEQRNPTAFIVLAPGVNGRGRANNNERFFNTTINGAQSGANEFAVEGVPILNSNGQGDFRIIGFPQDAVQEFKLTSNAFSADIGRLGGGWVNFNLKSGTNEIHGSVWEFLRNDALNANGFFTNQGAPDVSTGKARRAVLRQNEFGATAGGPIIKDKTFAFGWYSGFRFRRGAQNSIVSVPTEAFKRGDLSALLANGVQIYDPATTRADGTRDPFPGNIIPANRFDAVARNILPLWPAPTFPDRLSNNYVSQTQTASRTNQWGVKIDHVFTENHKIAGSYFDSRFSDDGASPYPGELTTRFESGNPIKNFRLSYDTVIRPNLLSHAVFGVNRHAYLFDSPFANAGIPAKIGLKGVQQSGALPQLNVIGTVGGGGRNSQYNTNFVGQENITWLKGRHAIKFGWEYRQQGYNQFALNEETGAFTWSRKQTSNPAVSNSGHEWASFLLGHVDSARLNASTGPTGQRYKAHAAYVQDDFKLNPRLTLNMGLRYDLAFPAVEVHNQFSWFDRTIPNPNAGGLLGAYRVATPDRRIGMDRSDNDFGPRFGFALQINPKTVIRGGYGVSFTQIATSHPLGYVYEAFNAAVNRTAPTSNPNSPLFIFQDGFPQSFIPQLPVKDPTTIGLGATANEIRAKQGEAGYVQSFNLNLQREIKGVLFDFAWAAAKGTRLTSRLEWPNALDPRFLSLGDLLTKNINSPEARAAGIRIPYAGFDGPVVQALRPFPAYGDVRSWYQNDGMSTYHSFQMKIDKRFSSGLNFLASYTWSKNLTNADSQFGVFSGMTQSQYNYAAEKSYGLNDIPHNLVLSYSYDMPFGPGKRFVNRGGVAGKILGGWKVSGVQRYNSGNPLQIMQNMENSGLYIGGFGDPGPASGFLARPNVVAGADPRSARYHASDFDPAKDRMFNINAFSVAPRYTIGNAPRTFGNLRNFAYLNEDFGIIKRTQVNERVSVDFRAEFFNAFNRTVFGYISGEVFAGGFENNIQAPTEFGRITGVSNNPRQVQFGLRINY